MSAPISQPNAPEVPDDSNTTGFDFPADLPERSLRRPQRTRGQNINAGLMLAMVAGFATLVLAFAASTGGTSSFRRGFNADDTLKFILGPIAFVALAAFYFMPTMVAHSRGHNNAVPIGVINTFFGWTLLGWVACLAWALSSDIKESRVYVKKVIVRGDRDDDEL